MIAVLIHSSLIYLQTFNPTLILKPSIASLRTDGDTILLLFAPICGSGPIVSKNVDGSGKSLAGIAVEPLTVGKTFVKLISCGPLCWVKDVVISVGNAPVVVGCVPKTNEN